MLSVSRAVKIYLYNDVADLRCGYDGLAALVQNQMNGDPLSGALYIFLNRRRNRIKLLYWDDDGYVIWMKRLEVGSFELPCPSDYDRARDKAPKQAVHEALAYIQRLYDVEDCQRALKTSHEGRFKTSHFERRKFDVPVSPRQCRGKELAWRISSRWRSCNRYNSYMR